MVQTESRAIRASHARSQLWRLCWIYHYRSREGIAEEEHSDLHCWLHFWLWPAIPPGCDRDDASSVQTNNASSSETMRTASTTPWSMIPSLNFVVVECAVVYFNSAFKIQLNPTYWLLILHHNLSTLFFSFFFQKTSIAICSNAKTTRCVYIHCTTLYGHTLVESTFFPRHFNAMTWNQCGIDILLRSVPSGLVQTVTFLWWEGFNLNLFNKIL